MFSWNFDAIVESRWFGLELLCSMTRERRNFNWGVVEVWTFDNCGCWDLVYCCNLIWYFFSFLEKYLVNDGSCGWFFGVMRFGMIFNDG